MRVTRQNASDYGDPARVLEIRHASIGRGHSGKTNLWRAARRRTLQRKLRSSLRFDFEDPRRTIDVLKEYRSARELLECRGLPATQEAEVLPIELYAGERKLAVLASHDSVGQVYHTPTSAPPERQERYRQHRERNIHADVLHVVLSVPAAGSSRRAVERYEEDLLTMSANLRDALRLRPPDRICAIALVLTKLDSLFQSPSEARREWGDDDVIRLVGPLVSVLEDSKKAGWAIVCPVSAFGFGTAELLEVPDSDAPPEGTDDEPEWVLRQDATVEPYGVLPLIVWTFLAGILTQEVPPEEGEQWATVCRLLQADLEALDGWQIPVKGGF